MSFVAAYDVGDPNLMRFMAPTPRFMWYIDRTAGRQQVGLRETLTAFFAARHAAGDRLSWRQFRFNGYRTSDRTGNFVGELWRNERGRAPRLLPVKGAIDCDTQRIMVFSIGVGR
jgi:hypothetical protein